MVDKICEVAIAHRLHGISQHKNLLPRVDKHSLRIILILAAEADEFALSEGHA